MREIVTSLLPYEIYIRLLTWGVIVRSLFDRIIKGTIKKRSVNKGIKTSSTVGNTQENNQHTNGSLLEANTQEKEIDDTTGNSDITHKLLQHIDIENTTEKEVINKLQAMERWEDKNEEIGSEDVLYDNVNAIPEGQNKDHETSSTQTDHTPEEDSTSKQTDPSTVYLSWETPIVPEIYNTNTNIESINKQNLHFETLKQQINNLMTRWLMIEYEKKLVEATIDFPDDPYFNTMLGDLYLENHDFKKAQTIYKKLHLQNEFDDKSLYKLGIINLELGDMQSAEYLLTKAKELKPENPKYYQSLAEVKYNLEKIDECIDLMEKAVDLRPTKFEYIEILWKLYKESDNIQLYYKTLLKMNALEPLNQKVRSELSKFQE